MTEPRPTHLSSGVVPVLLDSRGGEPLYLLLRAYNYWDFPKGGVLPGEEPLAAAERELQEETTLTGADFRWGRGFIETPPYSRGKVARYYLAVMPGRDVALLPNPELGRPEHHEYGWFTYAEASRRVVPRVRAVLDWAHAKVRPGPKA